LPRQGDGASVEGPVVPQGEAIARPGVEPNGLALALAHELRRPARAARRPGHPSGRRSEAASTGKSER